MMPNTMQQPSEGPYPVAGPTPPDQQPVDIEGALAMLDAILWRDGGIDQREGQILFAWVKTTQMKIQAQQQAQLMGQQGMADQQGLGDSSASGDTGDYNPFGGGPGLSNMSMYDQ